MTRGLHFSHFIVEMHGQLGKRQRDFVNHRIKNGERSYIDDNFTIQDPRTILWLILLWQEPLRWNAIMILDRSPFKESLNPLDLIEVSLAVFRWKARKDKEHFIETFHLN